MFTLIEVECLGACVNAPMVQINDNYYVSAWRADGFLIKHKYINFLQRMSAEAQTNEKEVNENHDRNIINLKLTINTNNIFNMDGIRTLSHPWPLFGKRFTLWARCDKKKNLAFWICGQTLSGTNSALICLGEFTYCKLSTSGWPN